MEAAAIKTNWNYSKAETVRRESFLALFKNCPIPDNELLLNLPLFIKRQDLSAMLFMNDLYTRIIGTHGIVMEFGVRWGKNLALFESLRGIYEPYNHNRKIVGFDTFHGFASIHQKDGHADIISEHSFSVTNDYKTYLEKIMDYHEQESPISHMKKYELIQGDSTVEIKKYLESNPETIIALAYFDFDIYQPTRTCLEAIQQHLTKGSIVGFDQLNTHVYPGETLALREVLGLDKYRIKHSPFSPTQSWIEIE
jgi:hypothetical protein